MKPKTDVVKDISFKDGKPAAADDVVRQYYAAGGFTAKKLGVAVEIVERMFKDKDCLKFFSFPACINATGTRGVVKDMIRRKWFDVIMGTCGTLDHDIARIYTDYYHGDFLMDDKQLRDEGINRLGNVLVPNESYGMILEDKFKEFMPKIFASFSDEQKKKGISTHEFVWKIGECIDKDNGAQKKKEESIVWWLWKNQIPMVLPAPTDGSVGYQVWQFAQDHDFRFNLLADETMLSDKTWNAKKSGALIIGGGISKHHVIWWNQFKQGGLDYAVYVTTAAEWDGSLSGAQPREAVSWGKIGKAAKFVNVEEDATIALPLIYAALNERMK
ncbi:MAG: deoxyhypusine synthase [Candidatus Aenigmarchaeota archaeon]|nr:deoxyhypusine synthase [Candidatus Aenigmarchaeota archaeon]